MHQCMYFVLCAIMGIMHIHACMHACMSLLSVVCVHLNVMYACILAHECSGLPDKLVANKAAQKKMYEQNGIWIKMGKGICIDFNSIQFNLEW